MSSHSQIQRLLQIMERLRDPENGCPWDLEQTMQSIASHTIEETYELVEALEIGDIEEVKGELGDLLFHIVFYAQMAKEQHQFNFEDIAATVANKMLRRHPHVFADNVVNSAKQVEQQWELIKQQEKPDKSVNQSALNKVSKALPAITYAYKIQKQAARLGFDWPEIKPVLAKLKEEVVELEDEINNPQSKDNIADELGDVMFSCINLARHLDLEPETVLRQANRKFIQRFEQIEKHFNFDQKLIKNSSLDELEDLWIKAKKMANYCRND